MDPFTKKYKIQDNTIYPHIGNFLRAHFAKNGVNKAAISRKIDVVDSATTRYLYQESIQFGILWKISLALNHNLLADLATRLPIPFATAREKELEKELQTLQQELDKLKIENTTFKSVLLNK
jgi:hypothetical protein